MKKALFLIYLCVFWGDLLSAQETKQSLTVGYSSGKLDGFAGVAHRAHMSAAIMLTKEMLNGNKIIAIRCGISSQNLLDGKLFIKKRLDREENLLEKEFIPQQGWNYYYLDIPFDLSGEELLYIGYELTSEGNFIGYEETKEKNDNADFLKYENSAWEHLSDYKYGINGVLCIQALLTGGDYSSYPQNAMELANIQKPSIVKADDEFYLTGNIKNIGVYTLENYKVLWQVDDLPVNVVDCKTTLHNGEIELFSLPLLVEKGVHQVKMNFKEPNGDMNFNDEGVLFTVEAYEKAFPRMVLIEGFTSQTCGNCPAGHRNINKVIDKYRDRVAIVEHHAGYAYDKFTARESMFFEDYFQVNSAPNMMLNRSYMTSYNPNITRIVFHPAYCSENMIRDELLNYTLIGLNIENVCYKGDSMLTITVKGSKDKVFKKNVRMNVFLTESGSIAYQAGVGNGFVHNNFMRAVLSDCKGDEIMFDENGEFCIQYLYKIPQKYESLGYGEENPLTVLDKMDIVAFISEFDENDDGSYKVYNAISIPLNLQDGTGMRQHLPEGAMENIDIQIIDSKLVVTGTYEQMHVFNILGNEVDIENKVSDGIYLIMVRVEKRIIVKKVIL